MILVEGFKEIVFIHNTKIPLIWGTQFILKVEEFWKAYINFVIVFE